MSTPILITSTERTFQSTESIRPKPATSNEVPLFSVGTGSTNTSTVTSSSICTTDDSKGSNTVVSGTTADPAATYIGSNGVTPMFALELPNGTVPPVFSNPLAAPADSGTNNIGFTYSDKTISQGLIGKL